MPQFSSYPVVTTIADADKFMIGQDVSGSEKLIAFSDIRDAVAAAAPTNVFLASMYTPMTANDNGGGATVDPIFSGSIRGTLTIPANTLVLGSVIKFRIGGYISTSGANRTFNALVFLQGQQACVNFPDVIAKTGAITKATFIMEGALLVTGIGAGGGFVGETKTTIGNVVMPQGLITTKPLDTTASALFGGYVYWLGGSAADTITITDALVELL